MNNNRYVVELESFNGPLDLLLNMIREKELNIFDINLDELTTQYLEFIKASEQLNIELASEYLVMAAYLLEIKSKSLLPKEEIMVEGEYEKDTREELIARLLEYKKIKEITKEFKERKEYAEQFLSKPKSDIKIAKVADKDLPLSPKINIDKLAESFMRLLEHINANQPIESNIVRSRIQPEEMEERILAVLRTDPQRDWLLDDLLAGFNPDLTVIVASFMALLDMARHQKVYLIQEQNWDDIFVRLVADN